MRKTILLAALLSFSAFVPLFGQESPIDLRPGDVLRINVWRMPEMSGEFTVAPDGTINHPLYRQVNVSGKSMRQLEQELTAMLSGLTSAPQLVLEPRVRVSVGGEVRLPNLYTVTPLTTIAEVVALAGGTTERGKLERVRVFRNNREIIVDLTKPEAGLAQQPIHSGDQIYVDRRTNIFRDYIAPAGSITAALAAIANIIMSN
jgi:protein involved in polysaccharide export with SLBB domain